MNSRGAPILSLSGAALALFVLVWCVFGQTLEYQFVNFDDQSYVYANPIISRGLSWPSIGWAFTHVLSHNWHPLTALSHMLDCQLFDLKAGGHHFTNVLFHVVAAILLMLALFEMTNAFWRSAFVAAVFAVHPLHVESVAWISERKDVLSATFFMLTLIAYAAYVRKQTLRRYLVAIILFAGGLLAKPMLVTVPPLLLLLDYWPLRRFENRNIKLSKLLWEKAPMLLMAAPVAAITIFIQRHGIESSQSIPLLWRVANAAVSGWIYLCQLVWPVSLAVFYPHPESQLPIWQVAIASILLAGVTAAAWLLRKTRPYFFCGWFWYLGMLIPVIGIIQVGDQAHADRYTYLPQIGLVLAATWGIVDLCRDWKARPLILGSAATVLLLLFTWRSSIQASFWRDSESLWNHTLAVTDSNDLAHERLASALLDKNRPDEAIVQAQLAVSIKNSNASAENAFGAALARRGQPDEALIHLRRALALDPSLSTIHYNIAGAEAAKGEINEAISEYQKQLVIDPSFAEAHNNLSLLLLRTGRFGEAEEHLARALQLKPNYPDAHNNLAILLSQSGHMNEAIAEWKKTLSIDSNNVDAHANLAWVLATSPTESIRNGPAALEHAERALNLSAESDPRIWRLVAVAQAELGHFDAAIEAAERGLQLARDQNNSLLVQTIESNVMLFRERLPVRDTAQAGR